MRSHTTKTVNNHVRTINSMIAGLKNEQRYNGDRLEMMKKLCNDFEDTLLFALYLVKKVQTNVNQNPSLTTHKDLIDESIALFEPYIHGKIISAKEMMVLKIQVAKLEAAQDLFIPANGERIRIIRDWNVLVLETAFNCLLYPKESADRGYKLSRHYAEVSIPDRGTGFLIESADRLQDIADFWQEHYKHKQEHNEVAAQETAAAA